MMYFDKYKIHRTWIKKLITLIMNINIRLSHFQCIIFLTLNNRRIDNDFKTGCLKGYWAIHFFTCGQILQVHILFYLYFIWLVNSDNIFYKFMSIFRVKNELHVRQNSKGYMNYM